MNMRATWIRRGVTALAVIAVASLAFAAAPLPAAHARPAAAKVAEAGQPYAVEYYYKVTWGHSDEWLRLFKKNHLPLLKALQKTGDITALKMEKPRYHTTEDGRWDYRVTITWKNFEASEAPPSEQELIRKMWPDQETYQREEQRRFEILIAHWDLPVVEVSQEP